MQYYTREDGTVCKAMPFNGGSEELKFHLFMVMDILAHADLKPSYRAEEETDEWQENEAGDDYEKVVIPEHIFLEAGNDKLKVGDYVIERDGDVYIMDGEMFEAIWSLAITDDMNDWYWHTSKRVPYSVKNEVGYWEHKGNNDIVSLDGGVTYYKLSERPRYQKHGPIYNSVKLDIGAVNNLEDPVARPIADVCLHCGKAVVNFNEAGEVFKGFKHSEGRQRNLIRCWPEDTGQPYGLDATPRSYKA